MRVRSVCGDQLFQTQISREIVHPIGLAPISAEISAPTQNISYPNTIGLRSGE